MSATKRKPLAVVLLSLSLLACQKPSAASAPSHHELQHESAQAHDHSHHAEPAATPLAGASIYHLQAELTDQDGQNFELTSLRGSAVLAAMFYASCSSVCPLLITRIKHIEDTAPADVREHTQVLLVSLDPERDTVDKLEQLAQQHALTDRRWHVVRTQPDSVREIAALLGIRYRQVPGGDIIHSPVVTLLDRDGVVTARLENAADEAAPLLSALEQTARDVSHAP